MLINNEELVTLGEIVFRMVEEPDYIHDDFWIISTKIIRGIIFSNKKMIKFPSEWKDICIHNATIKVYNNIRKFSPTKWNEARNKSGLASVDKPYKGVYEFIHLMVIRNIYNTIKKLITQQTKDKMVFGSNCLDSCEIADIVSMEDFIIVDNKITIDWIEKRLGYKLEREEDE